MRRFVTSICIATMVISGCTNIPQTADDYLAQAKDTLASKNYDKAGAEIEDALRMPSSSVKVREFFSSTSGAKLAYQTYLEKLINKVSQPEDALALHEKLKEVEEANLFSDGEIAVLFSMLEKRVASGNANGSIAFTLGEAESRFPILRSPDQRQIMVERTVKAFQTSVKTNRPIDGFVQYVREVGVGSAEGKRIEMLLPSMRFTASELDILANVYPSFASERKKQLTIPIMLQVKGGDRLFADDLTKALREKVRGVNWVTEDEKALILSIERIRHDEKNLPERTETVTYSNDQVNPLGAVMFMPKHASYMYDVVSGGVEIDYGYVVAAQKQKKITFDKVVRGKVEETYQRCNGARVQNVFGGTTAASFVANSDMQARCSGSNSASIEKLRDDVIEEIVKEVLNIPEIKAVHELN